jgi:putative addiction module CopG family antidote
MIQVALTPEQERFAADAVAQGQYRDAGAVVEAGLALLQEAQAEVAAFCRLA